MKISVTELPPLGLYSVTKDWPVRQTFGVFTAPAGSQVRVHQQDERNHKVLVGFGEASEWVYHSTLTDHAVRIGD